MSGSWLRKNYVRFVIFTTILAVWLFFICSAVSARWCRVEVLDLSAKVRYCEWASWSTPARYVRADYNEYVQIEIELAIAYYEFSDFSKMKFVLERLRGWMLKRGEAFFNDERGEFNPYYRGVEYRIRRVGAQTVFFDVFHRVFTYGPEK